jgi:hypothetical protein
MSADYRTLNRNNHSRYRNPKNENRHPFRTHPRSTSSCRRLRNHATHRPHGYSIEPSSTQRRRAISVDATFCSSKLGDRRKQKRGVNRRGTKALRHCIHPQSSRRVFRTQKARLFDKNVGVETPHDRNLPLLSVTRSVYFVARFFGKLRENARFLTD